MKSHLLKSTRPNTPANTRRPPPANYIHDLDAQAIDQRASDGE
jgi:hypothetical protein